MELIRVLHHNHDVCGNHLQSSKEDLESFDDDWPLLQLQCGLHRNRYFQRCVRHRDSNNTDVPDLETATTNKNKDRCHGRFRRRVAVSLLPLRGDGRVACSNFTLYCDRKHTDAWANIGHVWHRYFEPPTTSGSPSPETSATTSWCLDFSHGQRQLLVFSSPVCQYYQDSSGTSVQRFAAHSRDPSPFMTWMVMITTTMSPFKWERDYRWVNLRHEAIV